MNEQEIMEQMQKVTDGLAETLGASSKQHGMLRGTFEMALAEAQGAEIKKVSNFTPANQSYNHYESMRSAANSLQNNLTRFKELLSELRAIDPKAADAADKSFRPLTETAASRVNLAQKTEELIIEIGNTRNTTRLQGVPLNQGRDAANLASNQLRQMNQNLVPQGLARSNDVLSRIRELPTTINEARDKIREIARMVATTAAGYMAAARRAAQSATTRAFNATMEFLVAFGSRFSVFLPPIETDQLNSMSGKSSKGA